MRNLSPNRSLFYKHQKQKNQGGYSVKKSLVLFLVATFVLSIAGTALAFPVEFNGDIRYQFRTWDDKAGGNDQDKQNRQLGRLRLNFAGAVDQDVTLFGRLATRAWFGQKGNSGTEGVLDQYGVKIASNDWTYKLGRQAVSLGQGSVISTGYDVGVDNKFDGLAAAGKLGKIDTQVIIGKTTATASGSSAIGTESKATTWMGVDFSTPLSDTFTLGVSYAGAKLIGDSVEPARKYLGVNATFTPTANLTLNGEYVRSSASVSNPHNKAYFLAGTYTWDKDSFSIQYNNVGVNAVDPFNSGIGANAYPYWGVGLAGRYNGNPLADTSGSDTKYKGFTYTYTHQMSKAASFSVCYMDLKNDVSPGSDKELAAGFRWKF